MSNLNPNYISIFRIAIIPVLWLVLYWDSLWSYPVSSAIFLIAGVSDWLDGHIARKYNSVTSFGAFVDPVADKLLVVVTLCLLVEKHSNWIVTLPVVLIVAREITVIALRQWSAETNQNKIIKVSTLGKWKTGLQITAIAIMLIAPLEIHYYLDMFFYLGLGVLYISLALGVLSLMQYLNNAITS